MKLLESREFVVTCEIGPPRGMDHSLVLDRTRLVSDYCDAINIPDNILGNPSMSSTICAHFVLNAGGEPIVHMSTRDKNRISIVSELYGAYALGVRNMLFISGDPPATTSGTRVKMVDDIDSIQALEIADKIMKGVDLTGNALEGTPHFYLGATFDPYAPLEEQVKRTKRKLSAGARFFQTQAVFDTYPLEIFMDEIKHLNLKIIVGLIPLKGPKRAQFMNSNVPGIKIPEEILRRLESAGKGLQEERMLDAQRKEGLLIATETIKAIRRIKGIHGVHLMAIGWEESIAEIVKETGLYPRPRME